MSMYHKLVLLLFVSFLVPIHSAHGTSTDQAIIDLQAQIQELQTAITQTKNQQALQSAFDAWANPASAIQTTNSSTFTSTLALGARGSEVVSLQKLLALDPTLYPEQLVTGYFGSLTERAVKRFQERHNLEQIGIVGPQTRSKLNTFESFVTVNPNTSLSTEGELTFFESFERASVVNRDTERKSDISTLRLGVELYFSDKGEYPKKLSAVSPRYVALFPTDPLDGMSYFYTQLDEGEGYHLGANLEDSSHTLLSDDADHVSSGVNGNDESGCGSEVGRYCYDTRVPSAQSTPATPTVGELFQPEPNIIIN